MSFKAFFLSLTVTTLLLYSIVGTSTVYADDGTGTEPTTTEVAPTGDTQPETDVVTPTEDVQPPSEDTVPAVSTEEIQPAETVLEQLPENTTVTVLDSAGEVLPLASQETADVIESAYDPIWCPAGQDPTPGLNGCTASYSSFDQLLSFLQVNEGDVAYQQAGTIYIQQGAYLGGESQINFNNYTFTNLNNYDLTLQGGWDTTWDPTNPATPFPEYTTTTFNAPIIIGSSSNPWVGSLTINNIGISGVNNQTGLTVYSDSNVTLSDVEITNSQSGANLNADGYVQVNDSKFNNNANGGATINAGGDAYVFNSEFNNNGSTKTNGYGVKINSGGEVDLFETNASFNEIFGADVKATGPVYIDRSTFSGNVSYSYSCKGKVATGGYGLKVVSQSEIIVNYGDVPGDGIQANDNYEFGAYLEGTNVKVGYSTFNNNGYGLKVVGHKTGANDGNVTLQSVNANNNKLFGADILADNSVTVNNSFFNGNKSYTYSCKGTTYSGYGLKIVTTDGIYLTNVDASNNNLFGAHLDGDRVYIFGGTFNNNGSDAGNTGKGLEIISDTFVTMSDVYANNNQLFGANIQAGDDVSLYNGFFNGNNSYSYSCKGKTANGGYGVQIVTTTGDITITNIEASNNYDFGASLTGANVAIAAGTANFFNSFNNNKEGLKVVSTGNVALIGIKANNNKVFGADINAAGTVAITDGFFNGNISYTSSCKGSTSQGYGLQIVSTTDKDISLINIEANDNGTFGAHLEGGYVFVSYGTFSNTNGGTAQAKGLEVISSGNQTTSLYQVNASNNTEFGANITSDGYVSISDSIFSGNISYTSGSCNSKTYTGYGLKVVTTNNVNLYNVTANDNGTFGASLDAVDVQVTNSTFNNNKTSNGLTITAATVTLNNVTALKNGGNGAKICATISTDVNASNFQNNGQYGLNVGSPVFNQSGNTYLNNTSGSLFYNPSCGGTSTGGGNNHGGWGGWGWGWNWNHHKPQIGHGHGASYHGGSCNKSQHAFAKKW
ncbi:MAG: hypothetical protein IPP66_20590 [Anaerolineales bacterium]|nr:hypothetical protein [Anaerolineales bacterium]